MILEKLTGEKEVLQVMRIVKKFSVTGKAVGDPLSVIRCHRGFNPGVLPQLVVATRGTCSFFDVMSCLNDVASTRLLKILDLSPSDENFLQRYFSNLLRK